MLKRRLIQGGIIIVSILLILFIFFIVLKSTSQEVPDGQNPQQETQSEIIDQSTDSTTSDEQNEDEENNSSNDINDNSSNIESDDNNNDDDDDEKDTITPEQREEEAIWHPNPDAIVVGWSDFLYPKSKMQTVIDQIVHANTVLRQTTGEDLFKMKMEKVSPLGQVTYISEYAKYNTLFQHKIYRGETRQYISYPDDVMFGLTFVFECMYDETLMPTYDENPKTYRDKNKKITYYFYDSEEPEIVDTFEFIRCVKNKAGEVQMYVKGLGKYEGSNFIFTVQEQIDGLWVFHSLSKAS